MLNFMRQTIGMPIILLIPPSISLENHTPILSNGWIGLFDITLQGLLEKLTVIPKVYRWLSTLFCCLSTDILFCISSFSNAKSINFEFNANAATEGSTAYRELRGICLSILNFEENYQNHEFYQVAKKFIENNNFKYKEKHTQLEIYCALLTPKFTDFTVKKYINKIKQQSSAVLDIIELRQLYEHLSSIVGQPKMEALNSAIMESFLFCPVIKSFLQSITNHYLLCLLYRYDETSKQIFQLITVL